MDLEETSHINIHESASVLKLLKAQAVSSPKSRFAVGVDSNVALSALAKGRSPSYGLRPVMRRAACVCIAGCLYPSYLFAPTRWNPSDSPTRNVEVVPPVPFSICLDLPFESLLALSSASGLRRFLSNWARLALLVVGRKLSAWTWVDSGRFSHYSKSAYPYGWASRGSSGFLDFDKTLGFPGEGPVWIWFIFVFSSYPPGFHLGSLDFVRHFLLCSQSFAHSVNPVVALPPPCR